MATKRTNTKVTTPKATQTKGGRKFCGGGKLFCKGGRMKRK